LPAPVAIVTKAAAAARDGGAPKSSPALSLANQPRSIQTRKVALLALPGVSVDDVDAITGALHGQGVRVEVVSTVLGPMSSDTKRKIDVKKTFFTTSSVLYDAVVVPGGASAKDLAANADAIHFVRECFRHAKPIGAANEGVALIEAAALPEIDLAKRGQSKVASQGVVTARVSDLGPFTVAFVEALRAHRHFERDLEAVPA
jgi:catalase